MIELTVLNVIQIISLVCMVFCFGLKLDRSEHTRQIASGFHWFFLVILWICILVR